MFTADFGFRAGFNPKGRLFNPALGADAKAALSPRLLQRIGFAANALEQNDYLMGSYSVADAYLYTVLRWAPRMNIDLTPWPQLKGYMERITARPAVQAALKEQGLV